LATYLNLKLVTTSELGLSREYLNELISGHGSNCWSAVTIGRDGPELIIHNDSHSLQRTESNIMHELAHVLLEHEMGEFESSLCIPLRKNDENKKMKPNVWRMFAIA
jgi:hypothetical protein